MSQLASISCSKCLRVPNMCCRPVSVAVERDIGEEGEESIRNDNYVRNIENELGSAAQARQAPPKRRLQASEIMSTILPTMLLVALVAGFGFLFLNNDVRMQMQ